MFSVQTLNAAQKNLWLIWQKESSMPRMFMQAIMAGHRVQAEAPGKHFSPDRKRYPLETLCLLITVDVMSVMRVTTMHREDPLAHWVIRYKKITQ